MNWTINRDPPTDLVVRDVTFEARNVAERIVQNGGGKVARVRVEVEFTSGDEIAFERNP